MREVLGTELTIPLEQRKEILLLEKALRGAARPNLFADSDYQRLFHCPLGPTGCHCPLTEPPYCFPSHFSACLPIESTTDSDRCNLTNACLPVCSLSRCKLTPSPLAPKHRTPRLLYRVRAPLRRASIRTILLGHSTPAAEAMGAIRCKAREHFCCLMTRCWAAAGTASDSLDFAFC